AGFSLYGRARKALASMPGHARRYRMTRARFVAAPASSASRYESHLQPAYSAPAIVHMNVHGGSDGRRRSAPAVSTISGRAPAGRGPPAPREPPHAVRPAAVTPPPAVPNAHEPHRPGKTAERPDRPGPPDPAGHLDNSRCSTEDGAFGEPQAHFLEPVFLGD